jgi:hypothetical protein
MSPSWRRSTSSALNALSTSSTHRDERCRAGPCVSVAKSGASERFGEIRGVLRTRPQRDQITEGCGRDAQLSRIARYDGSASGSRCSRSGENLLIARLDPLEARHRAARLLLVRLDATAGAGEAAPGRRHATAGGVPRGTARRELALVLRAEGQRNPEGREEREGLRDGRKSCF